MIHCYAFINGEECSSSLPVDQWCIGCSDVTEDTLKKRNSPIPTDWRSFLKDIVIPALAVSVCKEYLFKK